jgi:serine/threonine-protein phosphatase PP1 catalytic subunit
MVNIQQVINDLMNNEKVVITEEIVKFVCKESTKIMRQQNVCLELSSPVVVCGDIHGQFTDLKSIFRKFGQPPETPYLFLGDYVDRGDKSIEVILLLLSLKVKNPYHIFLLRGNHECSMVNEHYGFKNECERIFGKKKGIEIWLEINAVFQWMPLAAVIQDKILCLHGGLSPELKTLSQLRAIKREQIYNIPDSGLVCDILWSDPEKSGDPWSPSDRGVSYFFNPVVVADFCKKNDLDLICRAHQLVDNGYEFFCEKKMITVFSAPNYCGNCGNKGAVLKIDRDLNCEIHII